MTTALLILIALVTLCSAATAMLLRNLIHSVLLLIGSWIGVSVFYLFAGAEFVITADIAAIATNGAATFKKFFILLSCFQIVIKVTKVRRHFILGVHTKAV